MTGRGLSQARLRRRKPPPQPAEQALQAPHGPQPPSTGSAVRLGHGGFEWHMISCDSSPTQGRPPCAGAGLVHERRRDLAATPHGCEHADQADQLVQPPWRVQLVTSATRPTQGAPPRAGAGLEHWRRRHGVKGLAA